MSASRHGPELTIAVTGDADWSTADELEDQLLAALRPDVERIVLDLGRLGFCNLRGLGALHEAVAAARHSGIDVTLCGMPRQLAWLHCAFPGRLSPAGRPDLPRAGARRGQLTIAPLPARNPWKSAGAR